MLSLSRVETYDEKDLAQADLRAIDYDPLTLLPARSLLSRQLDEVIALANKNGSMVAVCYLDIDCFKSINDRYGYESGDVLLASFAETLLSFDSEDILASRLGGDDFVVVLSGFNSLSEASILFEALLAHSRAPCAISEEIIVPSVSIGATVYPHDNSDGDTLIRHADYAMYQAKLKGKNKINIFDVKARKETLKKNKSVDSILKALANDEMVLHYQPNMDAVSREVLGFEALIRWQHPERGLLQPPCFLPDINDCPYIVELDKWVLKRAFLQLREWREKGLKTVISVNITSQSILQPEFIETIKAISKSYKDVPTDSIQLEVRETSHLQDMDFAKSQLLEIRKLGITIALDDFGTGYSSLSYLRNFHTDYIKIDQSFVKGVLVESDDLAIVKVIIQLSKTFKMKVVAEGVESEEVFKKIQLLGCDIVQGWFLSKAIPPENVISWMESKMPLSVRSTTKILK